MDMCGNTRTLEFNGITFDVSVQKWPNGWTMKVDIHEPLNRSRADEDNLFATQEEALAAGERLGRQFISGYVRSL